MGGRGTQHLESTLLNYKIGRTLGSGTFGKVRMAEHILTKQKVAIKILRLEKVRDRDMEVRVRREIKILRLLRHPHITRLYEVVETQTHIFLVMEYVNCGELFDYIVQRDRLPEEEVRQFFQQIISGVEHCHSKFVVHRDLKPENLLLDSNHNIKIADFGLSNFMRDGHFLRTICGSPNYAAPEVISGINYVGSEVDVWSCGVILYALLCAALPFDDENLSNLYRKIKSGIYTLPNHLSPGARDLLTQMLVVDPIKRITISKIQQHTWFQHHLPLYLAIRAPKIFQHSTKIDENVLEEAVNLGFEMSELISALQNKIQTQGTVTYNLLLDKHSQLFDGYLVDELQETYAFVSHAFPSNETIQTSSHGLPVRIDQRNFPVPGTPEEMKWVLGFQSTGHPRDIIRNVLIVLQNLNVVWKHIGHYTMKCKWFPELSSQIEFLMNNQASSSMPHNVTQDSPVSISKLGTNIHKSEENVLKFEVQLFKGNEDRYLLDLQRLQGPHVLFLDICGVLLSQL